MRTHIEDLPGFTRVLRDRAITFRAHYFPEYFVEVIDAPDEVDITRQLLESADPEFLAEGDGILTFCPEHSSRVSYRVESFDAARDRFTLERIS